MNTHLARASLRPFTKPITTQLSTSLTTPFARSFSSTMAKQTPKVLSTKPIAGSDSKFVELKQITYQDEDGKERLWEVASRKTRSSGGVDAVAIFALLSSPTHPTRTIIIEQYRPPIDKTVIELPAGLIDEGESPEKTALRELAEETGYANGDKEGGEASVRNVSGVMVADPGMTDANMHLVTVDVKLPGGENKAPKPKLEAGEHIVQRIVEVSKLWETLQEYEKKGSIIDARLGHLAYGIHIASQLNSSSSSQGESGEEVASDGISKEEIAEAEDKAKAEVETNEKGEIIGEEMKMPIS